MMLEVKNIKKNFARHNVLDGISLSLMQNDRIVIFGASGCGKSVLLKIIARLIEPSNGSIICNHKMGMLFQSSAMFDSLQIKDNIFFNRKVDHEKLHFVLHQVGLTDRIANLYPTEISGGMKKRVALARMIVSNAEIMLFDEPTAGLDPIGAKELSRVINMIQGASIVITHDIDNASLLGNRFILLKDGKIHWQDNAAKLQNVEDKYTRLFFSLDSK